MKIGTHSAWKQPTLHPPLTDICDENQNRQILPLTAKENNQNLLTESKIQRHHSEYTHTLLIPSEQAGQTAASYVIPQPTLAGMASYKLGLQTGTYFVLHMLTIFQHLTEK